MNKKTIKAIEGSVAKWDCIAQGIGTNQAVDDCPLCKLFINTGCNKYPVCPVVLAIQGVGGCAGTPYESISLRNGITVPKWIKEQSEYQTLVGLQNGLIAVTLDFIEEEVEFLVSLLPENHKLKEL